MFTLTFQQMMYSEPGSFMKGCLDGKFTNIRILRREHYFVETTKPTGEQGLSGGIAKRVKPNHKITNYIEVDSIDDSLIQVKRLGGKIIEPKREIPTVGFIAGCEDTEGNMFFLLQVEENVLDEEEIFKKSYTI